MKILLTGGGSGGHIAPVLAVAHELKKQHPATHLIYAIGKGDKLAHLPKSDTTIDAVFTIRAGKFRRYHGEGLRQILDFGTLLKNIRDFFYVCAGFIQSLKLLKRQKPDIIFIKGGFVAVPIGLAAALLKIPFITHDSDAVPGLANRIISRWARIHAVAMPIENYTYEASKTVQVGVPFTAEYVRVTELLQKKYKQEIKVAASSPVLLITGGGLGANRLNEATTKIAQALLYRHPKLHIIHVTGPGHSSRITEMYNHLLDEQDMMRVIIRDFLKNMHLYSGAADVIVARAGASSLAEFAAQGKACIIIPNPQLTGGHQLKNADILMKSSAIIKLSDAVVEKNPEVLLKEVDMLLDSAKNRAELSDNLHTFADFDASKKIATMLFENAGPGTK
ncbi:MAG: UDP-N-acetylglucosamine--N-acetylmuramyl-(pentapeptide) pyrophosphoryl-undecaprenol N-acetylglucosamine transferase [Candidatus Saccharibacteria bacterium]|nr:UDP-N-acetylglucosamine--N-acetylmuramyl-(pentapeptide) pyrophosphoryl-undecaprenol N-acetylglucosamine transferase [Candidatus Saccharibacteria bacterium]